MSEVKDISDETLADARVSQAISECLLKLHRLSEIPGLGAFYRENINSLLKEIRQASGKFDERIENDIRMRGYTVALDEEQE